MYVAYDYEAPMQMLTTEKNICVRDGVPPHWKPGNNISRGNGHLLLILYKVSSRALPRLYYTDLRYIVSPNMRDFASLGLWPFPDAVFY